jgi:predicted RNA-binding protein YlxR (DUF448 family)
MKTPPLRMCLGCREMKPKNELTRTVKSPEGEISLDKTGKSPGRGAYICRNTACLTRVLKANALARALRSKIPNDIIESLEQMEKPE